MMERGELMAADVLPKVAKEFARTARQGNALATAMKTARVSQRQFITAAQESADFLFQAGFGEGTVNMFKVMKEALVDSKDGLEGLAKTFKLVFDSIALVVKHVSPILNVLLTLLGSVADIINTIFVNDTAAYIAGVLALAKVFKALNVQLAFAAGRLLLIAGLLDEVIAPFKEGKVGGIEKALGRDLNLGSESFVGNPFGGTQQFLQKMEAQKSQTKNSNTFNVEFNGTSPEENRRWFTKWMNEEALQGAINGGG